MFPKGSQLGVFGVYEEFTPDKYYAYMDLSQKFLAYIFTYFKKFSVL